MKPFVAVCVLVLSAAPGCVVRTWQTDSRPIPSVVATVSASYPRTLRLTLRDGSRVTLNWPYLYRDTITGLETGGSGARIHLPLADVQAVARLRTDWPLSVVATSAATAGIAVGVAFVVCASGGCFDFHHMLDGFVSRRSAP